MVIGGDRPLLELSGISKSFGGVTALRDVDFTLHAGEIHGLVGENGAGKSTLMKIIAGVHTDYGGTMRIDGEERNFRSARDALKAGIGMVHQELSIVPDLSVAENVFLGSQPVTRFGSGGLAAHERPGGGASAQPRHRCRSQGADRLAADRASADDRDQPRAVLRRPDHHPGRADLRAVSAGDRAAVRPAPGAPAVGPEHDLHLPLPRRHPGRVGYRDDLPQRPEDRHRRSGGAAAKAS